MSWPNRRGDSFHGESLGRVVPTFLEIVRALANSETVFLNVSDEDEAALVAREIAGGVVELYQIPTNEPWCRDHGPVIVAAAGERLATCWGFNGWGGKYQPFDLDAAAAPQMADALAIKKTELPLVVEGGMIDSNGAGAALVARKALLDPRRNPGLTQGRAEEVLRREMGIERVLWLDEQVPGDDTDGHVDVYARFVSEGQIIACHDHEAVARIRSALPGFEILPLDPPPALEIEGQRVPAGYANFYIANRCVLLPVFGGPGRRRRRPVATLLPRPRHHPHRLPRTRLGAREHPLPNPTVAIAMTSSPNTKIGLVQMRCSADGGANIDRAESLIAKAATDGADHLSPGTVLDALFLSV